MLIKKIPVQFPEKLEFLFKPSRYKVAYGGRGGSKSWGFARALLLQGMQKPLRILCTREFQSSIKDSVHKLLADQIITMGLEDFYEVQQSTVIGRNGTEFVFAGLRHNINNLKSFESADIVWIEEAVDVLKAHWLKLIFTLRKEGSEIWISFNPELEEDDTYQMFVINPPDDAVVVKMNYTDNPFLSATSLKEITDLKAKDYQDYLHVCEGHCKQMLEGAIYAKEMLAATQENRITKVPYSPHVGVNVFFDLGWSDHTSLWFVQRVGFEYRAIRSYENRQQAFNHYLQYIQSHGYIIDRLFLPHDAQATNLGTGMSIEEIARAAGFKVVIVPKLSIEDGINAVRTIFPNMWFDQENCTMGIQALKRYRYDVDDKGKFSNVPLHDEYSDFADGIRYCAVAMTDKGKSNRPVKKIMLSRNGMTQRGGSWLGR